MDREDLNQAQQELKALRAQDASLSPTTRDSSREGLEGTSLYNAPQMGQAFDQASKGQDNSPTPERAEEGIGSQQVKDQAMTPELRPPPKIAKPVDQEKHASEMQRDDEAARLANYEAMADRLEQQQGQQLDRGYEL